MKESEALLSAAPSIGLGALLTTLTGAMPWRGTGALLASLKWSGPVLVPLRGSGDSGAILSASLVGLGTLLPPLTEPRYIVPIYAAIYDGTLRNGYQHPLLLLV